MTLDAQQFRYPPTFIMLSIYTRENFANYCGQLSQAALHQEEREIEDPPIEAAQAAPAPSSQEGRHADFCIRGPRGPISRASELFATLPAAVVIVRAAVSVRNGIALPRLKIVFLSLNLWLRLSF